MPKSTSENSPVPINKNQKQLDTKKARKDRFVHYCSCAIAWLFSLLFLCLIAFIIYAAVPGIKEYGFKNILFTGQFDLNHNQASVWLPLCVTIISAGIAILIAGPIGIKSSVFIKYRVPKRYQKGLRVAIELLADIPSVIFGLFASQILSMMVGGVFGKQASYSIITASFMLTFMILPTIVSLSLNALDGVDDALLSCAMALGNTKTRAIYKVCKKDCRNGIATGILLALSRAIGETMAVSMILQSQLYNNTFDSGFWGVLTSGLRSLGALISANMFAESGGPGLQGLLFTFGIIMFIFVIIINAIAMRITKKKVRDKYTWINRATNAIGGFLLLIPNGIKMGWERLTYHHRPQDENISDYVSQRVEHNRFLHTYDVWKNFWEYFSIIVSLVFLFGIILSILVGGCSALASGDATLFQFTKDTTGQSFINTLLIVIIAIGIGFPLSLLIAIYINEFAKAGKLKSTLLFFIDSLGATPSILFGMFGLIFFIQTLGMTSQGTAGKSLIAGILTILIVILPSFIRTIQQALASVPVELRENSYALGAGKWETVRKVVFPMAMQGIMTSIVLAIGRILAETAPLYLTSGLASSSSISLLSEGQTLTTRIYAQIYEANVPKGTHIMYECALVTMILVLFVILIVHVLIPWYYKKKARDEADRYTAKQNINQTKANPFYVAMSKNQPSVSKTHYLNNKFKLKCNYHWVF